MHLLDPKLTVLDLAPGLLEMHRTLADGFHLGSEQLNAGFEGFFDKVFMMGLVVSGHDLYAVFRHIGSPRWEISIPHFTPNEKQIFCICYFVSPLI